MVGVMHRRAFMDPRHLIQQAGQVVGLVGELAPTADTHCEVEQTLVRYARPAMGTVFEIVLPFGHALPTSVIHEAFDLIDDLEEWMSIYQPSSEVSEVNRRAVYEVIPVSEPLHGLLKLSLDIHRQTGGAFDVAAGALVDAWGYVRGPKRVPDNATLQHAREASGSQHVELGSDTVRFLRPGLQLNFGSIGKGYALDVVSRFFRERCPEQPVLLHGGKSSILALGSPPGHSHGWSVRIDHPWNPDSHLATLHLRDEAIATSANTFKHVVHEGKKLGHVLDPRTGWPAAGIASATACTSSAALSDALSTAFFVMGVEETQRYCASHPEISACLLPEGLAEPVWS
jgi:thiamine biosynthesis lipoprotein